MCTAILSQLCSNLTETRESNRQGVCWRPWSRGSTGGSDRVYPPLVTTSAATGAVRDSADCDVWINLRSKYHPPHDRTMSTDILRNDARKLFERVFQISLPEIELTFEDGDRIQQEFFELETELNCVKSMLNDKDPILWRKHTSHCNKASHVSYKLSHVIGQNVPLVTQAFLKFFEILSTHDQDLVPSASLKSFHLCEAPGAFITALEQFLLQKYGSSKEWHWRASTLNPYFEGNSTESTFVDDRLIFETLDNWIFGALGTGNIFSLEFNQEFTQQYDLVTADGSIDCQNCPAEQEMKVLSLFYAETRSALRLLRDGGSFVIKMFTYFHRETRELLHVLCKTFTQVTIRKPSCSRSSNSETYLICVGYKLAIGREIALELDRLVDRSGQLCGSLNYQLSDQFQRTVLDISRSFVQWQTDTIKENVDFFDHMTKRQREKLEISKTMVSDMYISRLHIKKIKPEVEALRQLSCACITKPSLSKGRAWNVVSFEDRGKSNWWKDHAEELFRRLQELHPQVFKNPEQDERVYEHRRVGSISKDDLINAMRVTTGECCSVVTVSKFIEQSLLDLFHMMFPRNRTAGGAHHPPQAVENAEKNEIIVTIDADFSTNEARARFLREVERELEALTSASAHTLLLEVTFSETVSRFAAGLVFLLAYVCDEVEFAATRIDHICFTFSFDQPYDLEPVLAVIQPVREALQNCLPGMTVVEIFPLRTICLSPFFRFLRRCNERYYATNLAAVELLRLVEERSNLNAGRTASLTTSSSFALS
ncbi:cap-specific mRNA (nucleoside-2'-O-)-methyltransferase 2-like isoform X2 [Varroa destructor]|uniref:Cap-specific mRNA (nucleoside-2'-O-)-methyltransferase 2 n=1 Tax=Varroa destructor TaxID=109461 RepID=A0A7M7KLL7_VARDE|nr:cap-specific mRNA (nucleoside-2'-O-)-methyltransferase 2-like isoform X2 [Varroa destructor]